MKTIITSIILISLFHFSGFSQNRIATWNTEMITSISLEISTPGEKIKNFKYVDKSKVEKIIEFLTAVDFKAINPSGEEIADDADTWKYHLEFHGLKDQVYLFKNHAFIGKSDYRISKNVIEEFEKFHSELE